MSKSLPSALEQVLRGQQINETEPGPILHDVGVFLDFIASGPIQTTGKHNLLAKDALAALNARMARPLRIRLKLPRQKSYSNLHGLYMLARAAGLMRVERVKQGTVLVLDAGAMESWLGLNPTERYFALLEAWWLRATPEVFGERQGWRVGMRGACVDLWNHVREEGLIVDKRNQTSLPYFGGLHNLALMEMFGLLRIRHGKPQPDKAWIVEKIERTDWGRALIQLLGTGYGTQDLMEGLFDDLFGDDDEETPETVSGGEVVFDGFRELLHPYFPAWRNSLTLPGEGEFREGVFRFNVSLGKAWRRIAIPAQLTLDDLSGAILNAFDFDFDHLYEFIFQDRFGRSVNFNHREVRESPFADEMPVGRLPLRPGEAMVFHYDFGDDWRFRVELEAVEPPQPKLKNPQVIESHGKAPRQYGGWDE